MASHLLFLPKSSVTIHNHWQAGIQNQMLMHCKQTHTASNSPIVQAGIQIQCSLLQLIDSPRLDRINILLFQCCVTLEQARALCLLHCAVPEMIPNFPACETWTWWGIHGIHGNVPQSVNAPEISVLSVLWVRVSNGYLHLETCTDWGTVPCSCPPVGTPWNLTSSYRLLPQNDRAMHLQPHCWWSHREWRMGEFCLIVSQVLAPSTLCQSCFLFRLDSAVLQVSTLHFDISFCNLSSSNSLLKF